MKAPLLLLSLLLSTCILPACILSACILSACILGSARPARAQTSFVMIGSVYPAGAQRGKTTEVTVTAGGEGGANLYGAYRVVFEGAGVQAEVIPPEKGWPARDPKKPFALPTVNEIKLHVTVAPDAPLGVREFRIATSAQGVSTVGQLVIGDDPEILEIEPNNDIEHAQTVPVPCVVNGRLQQGEDIDCFKFKAEAGMEMVFTALCARLEDKIHDLREHADPLLILRDLSGKELAFNDDYYRADPLLHYKFARAGEYVLQIRDVNYKGNPHWVYRITITTRPYITAVLPCAVRPGQSNELHITGYNLGEVSTVRLDVPANTPLGQWAAPLTLPRGTSNLVPLLVSDLPQAILPAVSPATATVSETARTENAGGKAGTLTNTSLAALPRLVLPGGVSGALQAEAQVDRYLFTVRKGEAWGFEVTARRLDSEMDSELKLRDSKGNVLAVNDDAFGKDSRIDWTAPADGDYIIEVRDLAGHAGPGYYYNLSARPLRPDFRLKCDTDRAMIAPGNSTAWYLLVERKYGFAGEVKVEVKGLPAGVTASPLVIPPEMKQGVVVLTAAHDAKTDVTQAQVVGEALLPGEDGKLAPVRQVAHPLTEIYLPGGGRGLLEVRTQAVAVTEPNDLEVSVSTTPLTLKPGGTAKVEVTLKRRSDYTKPVTLDVRVQHNGSIYTNPLPPGVTIDDGQSKTLLGDNETKGYITFKAAPDAKPIHDWPIAILANVSINFVMRVWYTAPPVALTVTPPDKK